MYDKVYEDENNSTTVDLDLLSLYVKFLRGNFYYSITN